MHIHAIALEGLARAERSMEAATERISRAVHPESLDSVHLSEAAVSLLAAKHQFTASIRAVQAADEMTRETLDLFA